MDSNCQLKDCVHKHVELLMSVQVLHQQLRQVLALRGDLIIKKRENFGFFSKKGGGGVKKPK